MAYINVNMHGQVTLPAEIRRKHNIEAYSSLLVEDRDDEIVLKKARMVGQHIFDKLERLADEKGITQKDVVRICREVRQEIYDEERA